ncbi:MAG: hypothetical protein PHS44_01875 [Candidatus Dojkabacteria bacterium]|nr:hypothetical protein [Candidatus Dojkabacteria bacterium]
MKGKIFIHKLKKIASVRWLLLTIVLFATIGYHLEIPLPTVETIDTECPQVLVTGENGQLYYEESKCKDAKRLIVANAALNIIIWLLVALILDHFIFRLVLGRNNHLI